MPFFLFQWSKKNHILIPKTICTNQNFQCGCLSWYSPFRDSYQRLTPEPVFNCVFNPRDLYYRGCTHTNNNNYYNNKTTPRYVTSIEGWKSTPFKVTDWQLIFGAVVWPSQMNCVLSAMSFNWLANIHINFVDTQRDTWQAMWTRVRLVVEMKLSVISIWVCIETVCARS